MSNFTVWFLGVDGQKFNVNLHEPAHYTDEDLFQLAAAKLDESATPLFVEEWHPA